MAVKGWRKGNQCHLAPDLPDRGYFLVLGWGSGRFANAMRSLAEAGCIGPAALDSSGNWVIEIAGLLSSRKLREELHSVQCRVLLAGADFRFRVADLCEKAGVDLDRI